MRCRLSGRVVAGVSRKERRHFSGRQGSYPRFVRAIPHGVSRQISSNFRVASVHRHVRNPLHRAHCVQPGFKFLFLFGHSYPRKTFYSLVSESPYFPVQIIFALTLGWLLGRVLRHRSMVWVWVLPLAILCYSVATSRVLVPTSVFASPGAANLGFHTILVWVADLRTTVWTNC